MLRFTLSLGCFYHAQFAPRVCKVSFSILKDLQRHLSIHLSVHPFSPIHHSSSIYPFVCPSVQLSVHSSIIYPFIHLVIHPCIHCLFVHPFIIHSPIYSSIHLSVCSFIIHPSINLSIHPSTHLFTHPFIHLLIHPCIHLSVCSSIHPCIHLFIHPALYPSACLFVHLSIHLFIMQPSISLSIPPLSIHASVCLSIFLPSQPASCTANKYLLSAADEPGPAGNSCPRGGTGQVMSRRGLRFASLPAGALPEMGTDLPWSPSLCWAAWSCQEGGGSRFSAWETVPDNLLLRVSPPQTEGEEIHADHRCLPPAPAQSTTPRYLSRDVNPGHA